MRTFFLANGRQVSLGRFLGEGSDGMVFLVNGTKNVCAKIFTSRGRSLEARLRALIRMPQASWAGDHPEHWYVAWPKEIAYDGEGNAAASLMALIDGFPLLELFDQARRTDLLTEPTWGTCLQIAARIARLFDKLHKDGVVVGDVSPRNIIISRSGDVSLIDCDSMQFTDVQTGQLYSALKATPDYAAPDTRAQRLAPEHDLFGLAILVCQLLMDGEHPFEGVPPVQSGSTGVPDNIRSQSTRFVSPDRIVPSAHDLPLDVLPPGVLTLARQCFGAGFGTPKDRPLAHQWLTALQKAGTQLRICPTNSRHVYHAHPTRGCIWCTRTTSRAAAPGSTGAPRRIPPPPGIRYRHHMDGPK